MKNELFRFCFQTCLKIVTVVAFLTTATTDGFSEETKFNVGIIIPLTGDLADYGTSIRRGFDLASSAAPAKFSNIRFVYEDSRYDGKTAVSALEKLRQSGQGDLYYLWGVSPTEAILPITEARKLPVIVETTLKESTANKKYVIRAARTGERIAQSLTDQLVKRGIKSVSFLNAEIPFYDDILKHLEVLLPQHQIAITKIDRIPPSENDIRPFVVGLKQKKPDAVGVFLLPSQLVAFYRGVSEYKLGIQTFSADIIGSQSIVDQCPDSVNGTFFTEVGVTPEFQKLYEQHFGTDGHIGHAAQAFDVANLISELFGTLNRKPSNDEIMKALFGIAPRDGATGHFSFMETLDGGKELRMPVAMKEIRDKRIQTVVDNTGY